MILPSTHIKMRELTIARPVTIRGKPGTILEITHGTIVVDFEHRLVSNNAVEKYKDVFVICECHIIFSDRSDHLII